MKFSTAIVFLQLVCCGVIVYMTYLHEVDQTLIARYADDNEMLLKTRDLLESQLDEDGDGFISVGGFVNDCDEADHSIHLFATDNTCDGVDQNCDGVDGTREHPCSGEDYDNDGWLDIAVGPGLSGGRDCDDDNPSIYPGAIELCDGYDNDCDGEIDESLDCR